MATFWLLLSLFGYSLATFLRIYVKSNKRFLITVTGVTLGAHALLLYHFMFVPHGLNFGLFNAASLMMWVAAWLVFVNVTRQQMENLLVVIFPITVVVVAVNGLFESEHIIAFNQGHGVKIHIFASVIAYSLLSIAAVQAVFLAIQDYQLRRKRPGWVMRKLPPLHAMEALLFQIIFLGFIFLSLSLITGVIFLEDMFAQSLTHKIVLSTAAWIVFGILLFGHVHYGWRGRKASYWYLGGFFVLMLAYFGSKLVLELILHR